MAKIAILGLGTVGGGVAEVLRRNGASISDKLGEPLELRFLFSRPSGQFLSGYRLFLFYSDRINILSDIPEKK